LYVKVFDSVSVLDSAVTAFAENLCTYNPKAMLEMKTMFWRGTEDWDMLLTQRAKISGRLVLSEFTKEKLRDYK
jgi:methylglutaconyl-CoA hydratase